jgi:aspartate kinase
VGTLICDEEEIMEEQVVTGIAFSRDEAQISLRRVKDRPGVAAGVFGPLADAGINVDMIVQIISADGATTDITFTLPESDYDRAVGFWSTRQRHRVRCAQRFERRCEGVGDRHRHAQPCRRCRRCVQGAVGEEHQHPRHHDVGNQDFVLIDAAYTELAVRTLHSLYGLDAA